MTKETLRVAKRSSIGSWALEQKEWLFEDHGGLQILAPEMAMATGMMK